MIRRDRRTVRFRPWAVLLVSLANVANAFIVFRLTYGFLPRS